MVLMKAETVIHTVFKSVKHCDIFIPHVTKWRLIYGRGVQLQSSRAPVLQVLDVSLLQHT